MASVFAQLFDTPPFVAALHAASHNTRRSFAQLTARDLGAFITRERGDFEQALPEPHPPDMETRVWDKVSHDPMSRAEYQARDVRVPYSEPALQRLPLWHWKHKHSELTRLRNVVCRVRENGFKAQVVFEELQFGFSDNSARDLKPFVRVVTETGQYLQLPLAADFLHSKWRVCGGTIAEDGHRLWPLQANLDSGFVLAFAYTLKPVAGSAGRCEVIPYTPLDGDPSERAIAAFEGSVLPEDGPSSWPPLKGKTIKQPWALRTLMGDFMASGPTDLNAGYADDDAPPDPVARVGQEVPTRVTLPHIFVAISFAAFKERRDFVPSPPKMGGLVGMARVLPNIIVKSSVGLRSIEASVRVKRPAKTVVLDQGNGTVPHTCCDSTGDIGVIVMTDHNGPIPIPVWDLLFDQYEDDADKKFGGTPLRMVNPKATAVRKVVCSNGKSYKKLPRQGEFDNVHVAPRLKLNADKIIVIDDDDFGDDVVRSTSLTEAERERLGMNRVAMAPFCVHDCFHMHWRWIDWHADRSNYGFDKRTPYKVAGAPMVPFDQEVHLILHSAHDFTYKAIVQLPEGELLPVETVHPVLHHGGGYATAVGGWREAVVNWGVNYWAAPTNNLGSRYHQLLDAKGQELNPRTSVAAFYYYLRYRFIGGLFDWDGPVRAVERSSLSAADMVALREPPITKSNSDQQRLQRMKRKLRVQPQEKR